MIWSKEKLMKAFQHDVEVSDTKEEAFEMIDYLFVRCELNMSSCKTRFSNIRLSNA